ncbi:lipoprotein insertase outer membrane protein LolB [Acinetobacter bohemicus]|uniref:lipoprotein insertase outer membrane protein LolB n=1 Tax=Acinetobacter TaxID=469 RepID=UPI00209A6C6F|nr:MULTISPECIES: lipoprotein insertase outer membrane protein LolB [Acinetobacter]MCO8041816.1 lipoprotein insertase outer membrane protein LolB [Acinetobacter sp. S4400-12]MCU7223927.1 lipoprotein insertase outer membrane protein LolB [Acinetobacter bohemicus]
MRYWNSLGCSMFAATALFMTGCQHIVQPQAPTTGTVLEAENQFQLQGKIGVRTPQQSGSAFFTWVQQQEEFDIELTGILGVGRTQISGKPGQVTLNNAKTGLIQAESAEELLQRATGWQAPISHLVDWVQARPSTQAAQIQKDSAQRISQIVEDQWRVELSYNQQAKLPNRLILKHALENGGENRITMLIQNR